MHKSTGCQLLSFLCKEMAFLTIQQLAAVSKSLDLGKVIFKSQFLPFST